jgi:N4-(beta-N-acetylglucosaminyl)-L-asparaginase
MKTIASHNGLAATKRAWDILQQGGASLDACVEGISLVEDDPEDLTVGYGGLPNENGLVELDAAVMDGATHRAGAVAALRNVRHAAQVARLVMKQTNRVLLVGEGALAFARANGFTEENLLTEKARRMWHYWRRRRSGRDDWVAPGEDESDLELERWFETTFYGGGTVHCAAVDAAGDMACATSTSGHAFKLAGRVGDSPILGAGLYVDNDVGSCGAIGHGEATMQNCSSFAAVELMRSGRSPVEAGLEALQRVVAKTSAAARDAQGRPNFNLQLYLLAKDGRHAGVAVWGPKELAVTDEQGTRLESCHALFQGDEMPAGSGI